MRKGSKKRGRVGRPRGPAKVKHEGKTYSLDTRAAKGTTVSLLIVAEATSAAELRRKLDMMDSLTTRLAPGDKHILAVGGAIAS